MADVKKTVEIALKVVGIDFSKLNTLADTFKRIETSVNIAKTAIDNLQKSLNKIKPPQSLTQVINGLQQLEKVKIPSLTSLANGFNKISQIKAPPDLSPFVAELKKFANIKLPGITTLVNGFKRLTEIPVHALIVKIRSLNTALAELDKRGGISAFKKFASDVNNMRTAFGQAATATNKIVTALNKTGQAADIAGFKIRTFGDKVATVFTFRVISAALLQLQSALLNGITAIIEYDQALKDLQAITGATTLEVAQMGIKILEVASTTKFSASEVAAGMRTIGQAGFSASEAVETMQAVSDLATGTLSDMKTTVDLVTTAMRVFQIDATESAMVADVFASAVNRSKLTIDKLRTAMNYIGPIARDSGVSFKELSASMMTLANSGLRASTIGTGLRRVFAELIDPSKKLKAAAHEAGVALNELDPRSTSLAEVMSNLGLVVNDAQVAFDLFGKRGAAAVLALTNTESRFNEMLKTVGRSGIAAQQAAIQMEGLGVSFKNLRDKLGILAIALGEAGIADLFRLLINLSRYLVDALTALAGTGLGKIVVAFGIATAAALLFSGTMTALASIVKIPMFASMISGLGNLVSVFKLATTSAAGFAAVIGPLGLALGLLATAIWYFTGTTEDSTQKLNILADQYGVLAKKFQDYELKTVSMKKGSDELKNAHIDLRNQLLETATGFDEISIHAAAAADAIDPVTGRIDENSDALEEYNKKLNDIRFEKIVQAGVEVNRSMEASGSAFNRLVNRAISDVKNLGSIFDRENHKALTEGTISASAFAKAIGEGNVSMKEMGEYIQKLDHTKLNTQQKVIIQNYKWINEQSDKFVEYLRETNQVGLDDTIENIRKTAEQAGYTGIALDAALEKIKLLQKANDGVFSNIIEKWAVDGTESVVEFIDEYKKLGGAFKEGEEAQLRAVEIDKQGLVLRLANEKQKVQAAIKAGADIEKTWKDYYIAERKLLQEAALIKIQMAESASGQNIKLIIHERSELKKELDKFAIMYKNNAQLRIKHQEDATRKYLEKEKKLIEGIAIDPATQKKAYEANLNERETLFAKHLENLAMQESKGDISSEQAQAEKLESTVDFYKESYREALKYQALIDQAEDPTEYEKRHQVVLKAEEAYYKTRQKFLNTYNSEVTKANKAIVKSNEKVVKESERFAEKQEKIKKDSIDKILAIDKDYAEKKEAIDTALQKKLETIDAKIAANRKSVSNDVLSLESDTEEKIRQIREKGLKGEDKERADRRAADKYLQEGIELVDAAQRDKDKEQLSRGVALIRQAEDIGSGLKNQRDAVNFLRKSLEALKAARVIEGGIDEDKLLADKVAEEELAALKLDNIYRLYGEKIGRLEELSNAEIGKEDERHTRTMENLDREIIKYREKIEVAKGLIESDEDKGGLQEITDSINRENERHDNELDNIGVETDALTEKYTIAKEELKNYGLSQEELDMSFDEFFESLTGTAAEAKEEVKSIMEDEVTVNMDNTEIEETVDLLDTVDNTILDVLAKVLGKNNVDALKASIDRLKDKTVTITTRYVTQGKQAVQALAGGGRLPGFGGGDRRPLLGEDGEWMINKFAVRKYGDDVMSRINNMTLPKFADGGRIGVPSNVGESQSDPSETLIVRFQAGGLEAPVKITDTNSRAAIKNMASELTKMRLIYAR